MNNTELARYLANCINSGLSADSDKSSLTNAFKIEVNQEQGYFDFIPAFPGPFRLTKELSDDIQTIVSGAVFPYLTMLGYPSVNLVDETNFTNNIHMARGLRFYFLKGGSRRIEAESLDSNWLTDNYEICLQENVTISPANRVALAVNGRSGSGKSTLANIIISGLLQYINYQKWDWNYDFINSPNNEISSLFGGKLINIIDPKLDATTFNFAKKHESQINYYAMSDQLSGSEFLNTINDKEADFLKILHFRQEQKLLHPNLRYAPLVLSIDEVQFATSAVSRQALATFQALTDKIILTGRSASGFLMLESHSFPIPGSISSASRDGLSYKFILGRGNNVTEQDTRFLMKNFNPSTIAMNPDSYAWGNGLFEDEKGLIRSIKTPLIRGIL